MQGASNSTQSTTNTDQYKSTPEPFCVSEDRLSFYGLKKRDDVSVFCREPYIHYGYRQHPSTVMYCLKSLLHPSNETLNVWTHLIPLLFMIYHFWRFVSDQLEETNLFILIPFWFFIGGVLCTLFGSTLAHTFNCLSLGAREVCFCCDYCSIALHAIGFTSVFTFYLCPYTCLAFSHGNSVTIYYALMFGNVICVYCSCKTRQYQNMRCRDLFRVLPYIVFFTLLVIPCIKKLVIPSCCFCKMLPFSNCTCLTSFSPACCHGKTNTNTNLFVLTCVCLLTGAIIHAVKFPERFFPGRFDIVGHSHQFFHIFTFLGLYFKSLLVESNLLNIIELQKPGQISSEDFFLTNTTAVTVPVTASLVAFLVGLYYSFVLYKMRAKNAVEASKKTS